MEITTSLNSFYLSAALPECIECSTDTNAVTVKIIYLQNETFSTTLYAYNGSVFFYDIRTIIESLMKEENENFISLYISFDNGNETINTNPFNVLFSQFVINNETDFLEQNFLTTRQSYCISRNGRQFLWWLKATQDQEQAFTDFLVKQPDGSITKVTVQETVPQFVGLHFLELNIHNIEENINNGNVISGTIHRGNREITFYVTEENPDITMEFRDAFNNTVIAEIYAMKKRKTEKDISIAKCLRNKISYDLQNNLSFEVETAALSNDDAQWLEQLICSDNTQLIFEGNQKRRIIIEDPTCEISDSDEDLNRIKFSFVFATDELYKFHRSLDNFFTEQFQIQFL